MTSPYSPGPGFRPAAVVGRDSELAAVAATLTRAAQGPSASPLMFTGPRGIGKTVLLGLCVDLARQRKLLPVSVSFDASTDGVDLVIARLSEAGSEADGGAGKFAATLRGVLQRIDLEVNAGLVKVSTADRKQPTPSPAQRLRLQAALRETIAVAHKNDYTGVALLMDEFQECPTPSMAIIATATQELMTQPRPRLAVLGAGLVTLPEALATAASFTERYSYRRLDWLTPAESTRALVEPALELDVLWDAEASDLAVMKSRGSPFLLQLIGDEAWRLRSPDVGERITLDATQEAVRIVSSNMTNGLFRARWMKATGAEQAYLGAMAMVEDENGLVSSSALAEFLNTPPSMLSRTRASLLDKGVIEAPRRGVLAFTMPGFGDYILSLADIQQGEGRALPSTTRRHELHRIPPETHWNPTP